MRISLLLLCCATFVYAQKSTSIQNKGTEQIQWKEIIKILPEPPEIKKALSFEGSHNDPEDSFLPRFYKKIPLTDYRQINVNLYDSHFENLSPEEEEALPKNIRFENEIKIRAQTVTCKKQNSAIVSFIPLRKNPSTGKVEKLISFSLRENDQFKADHSNRAPVYATNSVLQNGNWYKIAIARDGIFKLSFSFLQSIGLNPSSLDPRNIRIYGNGGRMLPELNSTPKKDDLVENAIYVEGENDGVFNSGDYVLFYGQGPDSWKYDAGTCPKFSHIKNIYSDSSYYFITADLGTGKRVQARNSSALSPTNFVTTFDDYAFHESEATNIDKTGKQWFGEHFYDVSNYSIPFDFPNTDQSTLATVNTNVASRYLVYTGFSTYSVSCAGINSTLSIPPVMGSSYDDIAETQKTCFNFSPLSSSNPVSVTKQTPDAEGWLDYIEMNVRRNLIMSGDQMTFRDAASIANGNISKFTLLSSNIVQVWEVTDPANCSNQILTQSGTGYEFTLQTDSLREFIAFNGNSFYTPSNCGKVQNQNLHSLSDKDFIIVTAPEFYQEAMQLGNYHQTKDSLSVIVATTKQIYNEFSSGSQDVSAIRNFVKMFYDKASTPAKLPKYLLLFGDASYDYKNRTANNTNFVPTNEADYSLSKVGSYCTDDFFGLLDDNEGLWTADVIDLGIGRIPVKTKQEASDILNKILFYSKTGIVSASEHPSCLAPEANPFGDWRNTICFIADDEDNDLHLMQSNSLAQTVDTTYNNYNIDKIYLDSYKQETSVTGNSYPTVNTAIDARVNRGAFIINYTGHGGENLLAHEKVLTPDQISKWNNKDKMFLLYTAACEFNTFDDPYWFSGAESCLLKPEGGAIAAFSADRDVFSTPMFAINKSFYQSVFTPVNGVMPRLGDIEMYIKSQPGGSNRDARCHELLGDPALRLAYPEYEIKTDSVNGVISTLTDTISALSFVTVTGHLETKGGSKLNSYNGFLYPTVYDKKTSYVTLSNDGTSSSPPYTYSLQNKILFKGKVSVNNGNYKFSFVVPRNINYSFGKGRISYYAENGSKDASGNYEDFILGGIDTNAAVDTKGPDIKLYMNDTKFINGGLTDENPDLLALLQDEHGINVLGNVLGHDINAVLDANSTHPVVLNDYYRADLNTYKSGTIRYPYSELAEGRHTLELTASDVYNNQSKNFMEFIVSKSAKLALSHVLNYPNPFSTRTSFYFEQNQCCQALQVELQIFTISGKLVHNFNEYVYVEGYRSEPIDWDGRDDFGDKIGKGVYIYRVKVTTSEGQTAEKYEKLVILN